MSVMTDVVGGHYAASENSVPVVYTAGDWHRFVDVFDSRFAQVVSDNVESIVAPRVNDKSLIGWFVDNELPWEADSAQNSSLVDHWIKNLNKDTAGKQAWIKWLTDSDRSIHYSNPAGGSYSKDSSGLTRLNNDWGTSFTSWDNGGDSGAVINATMVATNTSYPKRLDSRIAFMDEIAGHYYSVTTSLIRAKDPNHLIFSDRYMVSSAFISTGSLASYRPFMEKIWYRAAQHCDAFAVNVYYQGVKTAEDTSHIFSTIYNIGFQRPLLVAESNTQAIDTGYFPTMPLDSWWVSTQMNRARRYQLDMKALLDLSSVPGDATSDHFGIGYQWFCWADTAAGGFGQAGMVNAINESYLPLVETVKAINDFTYDYCRFGGSSFEPLAAPTGVAPALQSSISSSQTTLTWNSVPGASAYRVIFGPERAFIDERDGGTTASMTRIVTVAGTSYQLPDNLAQGWYYWTVAALDSLGRPGSWMTSSEGGLPSTWRFQVTDIPTSNISVQRSLAGESLLVWRNSAAWENNYDGSAFIGQDRFLTASPLSAASMRFGFAVNSRRADGTKVPTSPAKELAVNWVGPPLTMFSKSASVTMEVRPALACDTSDNLIPASKFINVRAWNDAEQLVLDTRLDASGVLPPNQWSTVKINFLAGVSHANIARFQFYVSTGSSQISRDTRVILNVDNIRPTTWPSGTSIPPDAWK